MSPESSPRSSLRSRPGVIVLAPPWPRSGSGNLFAAQAAAHARRGARVFLLLTPLGRHYSRHKAGLWADAVTALKSPGVETVAHPRPGGSLRSRLQWLLAGRDDAIAISGRYGASGRTPAALADFVASARVDLIHVNHVFSIPLARRVAEMVRRQHGLRPRLLLDTHDVQSDVFAAVRHENPLSHKVDAREALLRTELALCGEADTLIHLTRADFDFFASRLPHKRHELILPTLHPATEAELRRRRGRLRSAEFDFLYVGHQHEANLETVRWLLREVLPFAGPGVRDRICIIGSIGDLVSHREPRLYRRHEHLFMGEIPALQDFYTAAKAILAPGVAGTGSSIKLIEAMCLGKPILATSLALRGLPRTEMTGEDLHVHDAAVDFADAMTRLAASTGPAPDPAATPSCNAALYDRLFSNARYFAALDGVLDGVLDGKAPLHPAHAAA